MISLPPKFVDYIDQVVDATKGDDNPLTRSKFVELCIVTAYKEFTGQNKAGESQERKN